MDELDRHQRYLRGFMTRTEQEQYENWVSRRPDVAESLQAALNDGTVWDPEMTGRARAILALQEAFLEVFDDSAAVAPTVVRIDLLPGYLYGLPVRPGSPAVAAEQPEVVRIVNTVIVRAIKDHAVVVEIRPEPNEVVIDTFDGDAHTEMLRGPIHVLPSLVARLKIMAKVDPETSDLAQHGRITIRHDRHDYSVEATFEPGELGETVTLAIVGF